MGNQKALISILLLFAGWAPVRSQPVDCTTAITFFPQVTCEPTVPQITSITSQIFDVMKGDQKLSLQVYQLSTDRTHELFEREAGILKTMDSQHVLKVFETAITKTHFYKLCERITKTLDDYILQEEVDSKKLGQLIEDIVFGLIYIHKHNFIHGGLTTQSVYIGADGDGKISDFFYSMLKNEDGYVAGTTSYIEPKFLSEVDKTKKYTEKTDIYALGIILFRLSQGGRLPFDRTHPVELHILHKIGNYEVNPGTPLWVMQFVSACLRENEADRPNLEDAKELAMAHASVDNNRRIKYPFTLSNKRSLPLWIRELIQKDVVEYNGMFQSFATAKSSLTESTAKKEENNNKAKISYLNTMFKNFKNFLPNPFNYFKKNEKEEVKEKPWPLWVKVLVMVGIGVVCLGIGFLMGRLIKARRKRKEEQRRMTEQIEQNNI